MLSTHHKVPSPQCHWIRTERTMCAGFAARGRSGRQGRELHWSAPLKFAAVQSSPWLGVGPTSHKNTPTTHKTRGPPTKDQQTRPRQTEQQKQKGGQTQGGGGKPNNEPREPREMSSTQKVRNKLNTGQTTEAPKNGRDNTRTPTKRQGGAKNQWTHLGSGAAGKGRRGQQKEGQNREQHRDTKTKKGGREPGGSKGQVKEGRARTREGTHMP